MADRHVTGLLSSFLDDELGEDAALEVAVHVAHCQECGSELDELRWTRDALRALPGVAPPTDVFAAAAERATESLGRRRRAVQAAGIACLTFALGLGAFLAGAEDGHVVPPVEMFVVDHMGRTSPSGPMLQPVNLSITD